MKVRCLVAQSDPTLCDCVDCSPPGSSVHGDSPGNNTGVGCHALIQGILLTQGFKLGLLCLLHWQVCYLGSPQEQLRQHQFLGMRTSTLYSVQRQYDCLPSSFIAIKGPHKGVRSMHAYLWYPCPCHSYYYCSL